MSVDLASLVLHVLAATAIVGGGIVQVMAGTRVRAATTGDHLVEWASFARSGGLVVMVAAVVSLLTGGHLAGAVWGGARGGFANPFITLGILGWLLLMPVGPMVGGARLRQLASAATELGDQPLPADLQREARSPVTWGAIHSLLGVAAAMVWLMQAKPGWLGGAIGLGALFLVGWVAGAAAARTR